MAPTVTYDKISALWRFENNLTEEIGRAKGTEFGGLAYNSSSPPLGAFNLGPGDGVDDKAEIANIAALNPGAGDFSFSFLMKLAVDGNGHVVSKQAIGGNTQGYTCTITGGDALRFGIDGAAVGDIGVVTGSTVDDGVWHSYGCSLDVSDAVSGLKIFMDGIVGPAPVNGTVFGNIDTTNSLFFFASSNGFVNCEAEIKQFAFYKGYVLTADDAVYLHKGGAFRSLLPPQLINHAFPMNMALPMEAR